MQSGLFGDTFSDLCVVLLIRKNRSISELGNRHTSDILLEHHKKCLLTLSSYRVEQRVEA